MTRSRLPRGHRRLLSLSIVIGFVAASESTKALRGKVIKIADGDTLTLLVDRTQTKVRLECGVRGKATGP